MEGRRYMTHQKQISFLKRKTGVLLILITLAFFSVNRVHPQESTLKLNDLRHIAQQFQNENQQFLSYIFNLSFYHLAKNPADKLAAGLDALDSCIITNHFQEAEQLIFELGAAFPNLKENLTYKYGFSLLMAGRFVDGDIYLRTLQENEDFKTKVKFLRAYATLNLNQPRQCLRYLNDIEGRKFPRPEKLNEIKHALKMKPKGAKRYKAIALPLSMVIPGAGQAYSGFYFDAIQGFGFNLVLGYAAFASWQHELDYKRGDRNYVMPIISTTVWGVFYLTNIYSAANAAEKANLYRENVYYSNILQKFQLILKDRDYFLNISLNL